MPNPPAVETKPPRVAPGQPATSPGAVAAKQDSLADPLADVALSDALADDLAQGAGAQQRGKEGTAEGLANYEAALGKFLGKKLYDAVAPHLTLDKIGGYADDGLKAGLKELVGLLGNLEGDIDESAIDQFTTALTEKYATLASEYLEGDGKRIAEKLAGWVDTHPRSIVALALLAAGGAIAANMEIPELKTEIGITDELTAKVAAKLGKIQEISLKRIEAELEYSSGGLTAGYAGSFESEGTTHSHALTAGFESDKTQFSMEGTAGFEGDDLVAYGFDSRLTQQLGSLGGMFDGDAKLDATAGYQGGQGIDDSWFGAITLQSGDLETRSTSFDPKTGKFLFKDARRLMLDSGEFTFSQTKDSAGGQTDALSYEGGIGEVEGLTGSFSLAKVLEASGADSAYDLSPTYRGSLGLKYSTDALRSELDATFGGDGGSRLAGKLDADLGGNHSAGGSAKLSLSDLRLLDVGAYYGYRDPDAFTTFLGKYRYRAEGDTHDFSVMMEKQLGSIYTRLEQSAQFSDRGRRFETSAHGAYFVDDDVALIGGGRYRYDSRDGHGVIPEVGVQIKGVPLTVGYDTGHKAWTVGITIPFGR